MWPCGVIVHVSELFIAESKSQVYGQLHDLLTGHPVITTKLRKYDLIMLYFLYKISFVFDIVTFLSKYYLICASTIGYTINTSRE